MPIDDHYLKNAKISDVTEHGPHGADRLLVGPDHEGDVAELRQVGQEPHVVTQPSLVQISQMVLSLYNSDKHLVAEDASVVKLVLLLIVRGVEVHHRSRC